MENLRIKYALNLCSHSSRRHFRAHRAKSLDMQNISVGALLLMGITFSLAQFGIAPQHENGEAIVVNKCSFPVFYVSMGSNSGPVSAIPPNGIYREKYRLRYLGGDQYGGISIMLSSNQSIAIAANVQDAFFTSTITQFEYAYHPRVPPGLYYDISNVNGYIYSTDSGWNGIFPWPFQEDGLILEGTSSGCFSVVCPGGNPNGNSSCVQAYTHSKDDFAAHGCRNDNSLVLTLCTTTSALKTVIGAASPPE